MFIFSRDELPKRLRQRIADETGGIVRAFAAKYGCTPVTINRILSGKRVPDAALLKSLDWEVMFAERRTPARKPGRTRKEKP